MAAIVSVGGIKYVPKQLRVTIPQFDGDIGKGLLPPTVVDREDFTQAHADQIISFWKLLAKQDKTFDFNKAMLSTFDVLPSDEEKTPDAPTSDPVTIDTKTDVSKFLLADLKDFASTNKIDISDLTLKDDILARIQEAQASASK